MGELSVDLDQLARLAAVMQAIADDAGAVPGARQVFPPVVADPYGPGRTVPLESVVAAQSISKDLLDGVLIPAVSRRISTIGDVMTEIAARYRGQDADVAAELADTYRTSTGDWTAEGQL